MTRRETYVNEANVSRTNDVLRRIIDQVVRDDVSRRRAESRKSLADAGRSESLPINTYLWTALWGCPVPISGTVF